MTFPFLVRLTKVLDFNIFKYIYIIFFIQFLITFIKKFYKLYLYSILIGKSYYNTLFPKFNYKLNIKKII